MKNTNILKIWGIIALLVIMGFSFIGCEFMANNEADEDRDGNYNNGNSGNPIQLNINTWADGVILTSSSEGQWFMFTATAPAQYIHVSFGTLTDLYVQVYDGSGATVGNEKNLWNSTTYSSLTLATGQEYKIRVRLYSSGSNGTYRIGFTGLTTPPRLPFPASTQLGATTWANGSITSSNGEQWFRFTATASTQYIHVLFGTLSQLNILVYDSNGMPVGSEASLSSSSISFSRTLTTNQGYYIRIRPSSSSGTYQISFNTTSMPPITSTTTTQLNVNTWVDTAILTSSSGEQWFRFTATASTQYIHVSFGTLTDLYVSVYNNNGEMVGSEANLYSSNRNISRTLTVSQNYYIRIRPYSSGSHGTFKITLNNSNTPPSGG